MVFLKQNIATSVKIGPFIDDTDGKTAEIALTLTQGDIRLSKNGGDFAQKNHADAATTDELGYYDCPLNATDTGTLGRLLLAVHEAGALPVWHEYSVIAANVYDALFSTEFLDVNVKEVSDDSAAADALELFVENAKGTDHKALISADAQDLNATLHVNAKAISASTAAADSVKANIGNLDATVSSRAPESGGHVAAIKAQTDKLGFDGSNYVGARVKATDDIDLSTTQKASVNAQADTALADYDAPTKAEMDAGFAALNDITVEEIDAELTSSHGDGSWQAISGPGTNPVTLTLTAAGSPVAQVMCLVRDATNTVLVAWAYTDADGECVFNLDDGDYKVMYWSTRYGFQNPYDLTVLGATAEAYTCDPPGPSMGGGLTFAEIDAQLTQAIHRAWPDRQQFFLPTLRGQWINAAYVALDGMLRWTRATDIIVTAADREQYALDENLAEILAVEYIDADGDVRPLTPVNLTDYIAKRQASLSTGHPLWWLRHGDALHLYPCPGTDDERVTLWIVQQPRELEEATDRPVIPATLHQSIVDQALSYACRQMGEFERAQSLEAAVEMKIERHRTEARVNRGEVRRVRPHAGY